MIITEITELDKKRCKVFIDGEYAFVLYKGEIRDYSLKSGAEISENIYNEIMSVVLPKRAKLRAMNLLQKKDYTEKQLRDKLSEGMYPAGIIDDAVSYVKSFRYIDDDRYARDYITYQMENRSRSRITQDLLGKGLSKEVIMGAIQELYAEDEGEVEINQIRALLAKKHYDTENCDYKEKQKMMAFLLRKGYSMSLIRKVMSTDEYE
jgi:regulatory protein